MKKPLISIIVPVYKSERTIKRCIDSLLVQTYNNFELILVDDGSTDNSGNICDEYKKKDNRVYVIHKNNEGVSSARNAGLNAAGGNYITFIDSDDYVTNRYLEHLSLLEADLAISGFKDMPEHTNGVVFLDDGFYKINEIGLLLSEKGNSMLFKSVWGKLFKANIIRQNRLYFDKNIIFGEDSLFMIQYLYYCQSICVVHDIDYFYFISSIKKYSISHENYKYTIQKKVDAYLKLHGKFSLSNYNYIESELKDVTSRLFLTELDQKFSLKNYTDFKSALDVSEILYINNTYGGRIYRIIISLVQKKHFFLSFIIIRFLYPLTMIKR